MGVGGWAPDPSGRHQSRYFEDGVWSDTVSDSGRIGTDILSPRAGQPGQQVGPQGKPARRRRTLWVVLGIGAVLAAMAGVGLVLLGLRVAVHDLDTYEADLTLGTGDFPPSSSEEHVMAYTPDGFQMASLKPDQTLSSAVQATGRHTLVAVSVEVVNVDAPPESSIGPVCWGGAADPSSAGDLSGFRLSLASDGTVVLLRQSRGLSQVIDKGLAGQFGPDARASLQIVCGTLGGSSTVSGYVNDTQVVFAEVDEPTVAYTYTGFLATAPEPSEWLVTSFARHGPDDLPPGWNTPSP